MHSALSRSVFRPRMMDAGMVQQSRSLSRLLMDAVNTSCTVAERFDIE
jgi:hypothetical protein